MGMYVCHTPTVVHAKCHTHTLEYPDVNVRYLDHFFLLRTTLHYILTLQRQHHAMKHTHHFQCCWATVDLTWTVLQHQHQKQSPFLLATYRQFIRRQELSYTQTQKMMATNGMAELPNTLELKC
jgi:hypothetical protein